MISPNVTVYIPTRNRLPLLRRALESVFDQTYRAFEVVIVDDKSTDGTREFLTELSQQRTDIQVEFNEGQSGACFTRNRAISRARGEFITGLDDDDMFAPTRLQRFVAAWDARARGVTALCSLRRRMGQDRPVTAFPEGALIERSDLFLRNLVGSQVFLRTSHMREMGGFDQALAAWQDLEFLIRLASTGTIQCIPEASYIVDATHSGNRISTQGLERIERSCKYIIEKHGLVRREKNRLEAQMLAYEFRPLLFLRCMSRGLLLGDFPCVVAAIMRSLRSIRNV